MEIRSCCVSWESLSVREAGGQIQGTGFRGWPLSLAMWLVLSAYEKVQAVIPHLWFFFVVHGTNASSAHLWGVLAPKCTNHLGHQQVGAHLHVVQAFQRYSHHPPGPGWSEHWGVERDQTQPLSLRSSRPGQVVAMLAELPEGDDTVGWGPFRTRRIWKGFIEKAVLERVLEGEKHLDMLGRQARSGQGKGLGQNMEASKPG